MDNRLIHLVTKDGWLDVPSLEVITLGNMNSIVEDKMELPKVTSASIQHILSIFRHKFTVTFNMEDIQGVHEAANTLGLKQILSSLTVKQFQCSNDPRMKNAFMILSENDEKLFRENYSLDHYQGESKCKEEVIEKDSDVKSEESDIVQCKLEVEDSDEVIRMEPIKDETSPRKYVKGGGPEHKKMKDRIEQRLSMKKLILAEPQRARLFDRSGGKNDQMEVNNFPGLILDDQKTKFNICINCCEVVFVKTLTKLLQHQCTNKTDILKDKPIEFVEIRSKFHNLNHLKQYYTDVSVDVVKCNLCGCELNKIAQLKEHLRKVHELNLSNHMCPECGKRYASVMMVRQHQVEKHGGIGDYQCQLCSKTFVEKSLLNRHHKLLHSDVKPYICDICAQGFKRKAHLDRHRISHSGERNFPCRYCEMAFGTEWTRTQHERRHLGIKPYKCTHCLQDFAQKTSLDSHIRVHHSK